MSQDNPILSNALCEQVALTEAESSSPATDMWFHLFFKSELMKGKRVLILYRDKLYDGTDSSDSGTD